LGQIVNKYRTARLENPHRFIDPPTTPGEVVDSLKVILVSPSTVVFSQVKRRVGKYRVDAFVFQCRKKRKAVSIVDGSQVGGKGGQQIHRVGLGEILSIASPPET
jgi:hypothetical protein